MNKVKAKYRKKTSELVACGTDKKKRGRYTNRTFEQNSFPDEVICYFRKKRKQAVNKRGCRKANEIQNSEENDDSSDYAFLKEKTKKLKKRRGR